VTKFSAIRQLPRRSRAGYLPLERPEPFRVDKKGQGTMAKLLTVAEFKETYRVSHSTFYRQVAEGRLRTIKIGRATRISQEEAERWASELPDGKQAA